MPAPTSLRAAAKRPTDVAPPPASSFAPVTTSHFLTAPEYVDTSVPYIKFIRYDLNSVGVDPASHTGDMGKWSDLDADSVEMLSVADSPERALWDITEAEARKTMIAGPITVADGPIRGRLAEIGIRRHEWESLDADTRRVIKESLRAEADLIEAVVAAAIVRDEDGAREIQRKAVRYLEQVTADLGRRSKATTNPIAAIRRDRAWHAAQPLLGRLTELLTEIAEAANEHDMGADEPWVDAQVARVNLLLTSLARGRYFGCCTRETVVKLKVRTARQIALEITHFFHRDVTVDDLRRTDPPRQRSTPDAASAGPGE